MQQLEEGGPDPLVFVLNANLLAMVKLVNCELKHCSGGRIFGGFFKRRGAAVSVESDF